MISNLNKSKKPKGGIRVGNIANTKYYKMPDGSIIDDQGKLAPAAIAAALGIDIPQDKTISTIAKQKEVKKVERADKPKDEKYIMISKSMLLGILKSFNSLTTKLTNIFSESKKLSKQYTVLTKNIQTSEKLMTRGHKSFLNEVETLKDDIKSIFRKASAPGGNITPVSAAPVPSPESPVTREPTGDTGGITGNLIRQLLPRLLPILGRFFLPITLGTAIYKFMDAFSKEQEKRRTDMGIKDFDPWTGKMTDKEGKEISPEEYEKKLREFNRKRRTQGYEGTRGTKQELTKSVLIEKVMNGEFDRTLGIDKLSEKEKMTFQSKAGELLQNKSWEEVKKQIKTEVDKLSKAKSAEEDKGGETASSEEQLVLKQRGLLKDSILSGAKDGDLSIDNKLPETEKDLIRENAALRVDTGISWEDITRLRRDIVSQQNVNEYAKKLNQTKNTVDNNTSQVASPSAEFNAAVQNRVNASPEASQFPGFFGLRGPQGREAINRATARETQNEISRRIPTPDTTTPSGENITATIKNESGGADIPSRPTPGNYTAQLGDGVSASVGFPMYYNQRQIAPNNNVNKLDQLTFDRHKVSSLAPTNIDTTNYMSSSSVSGEASRPNLGGRIEADPMLGQSQQFFATYQPNRYLYNEDTRYFSNSVA